MLTGGIIGIGKIAQTGHLRAFDDERLRASVQIVAAADGNEEIRRLANRQFPHLRLYSNAEEMLTSERLDFVDICSPPYTHAEMIEAALRHRLHILCEKPLATSSEDAARLSEEIAEAPGPLVFMPCHQYRYAPVWERFRSFVKDRGSTSHFQAQFEVYRTEPDPGILRTGEIWRLDPAASGGGILADTGIHYLYLILWLFGMPIKVTARTFRYTHAEAPVEDTATVILEGTCWEVRLHLTWAADRRANRASVVCTTGSLSYDGETVTEMVGEKHDLIPVGNVSDKRTYITQYVSLFSEFVRRIDVGMESSCAIGEARDTVRLLRACYASAASNTTVTV